jgi:hypothetical protein
MSYKLIISQQDTLGKPKFINSHGHTECVEFVRQATAAPSTINWKQGKEIASAGLGEIARGTAIASFDERGKYPVDSNGKHAAIYLSHDLLGIRLLDQWNEQGEVLERIIYFNKPDIPRSNAGKYFYVIE